MSVLCPVDVLRAALGDELSAGQVAVVLAPPGVGKTSVVVHVAIAALREGQSVLHVAVGDTVEHVRAHYDQALSVLELPAGQRAALERKRMVHAHGASDFDVDALRGHIELLSKAGAFTPELLVVDGLDSETVRASVGGLAQLASDLGVPLWVTMRLLTAEIPPEVRAAGSVGLRLTPRNGAVWLSVLRRGEEHDLDLALTADALLVAAHRVGADQALEPGDVTLYSGGAKGSEAAFGRLAERHGLLEVNYTFAGHRVDRAVNARELSARELEAGNVSMTDVSRRLNRTYSTEGTLIRKVLQTLWHVVSRAQKVFVVGAIQDDDTVVGGTGWSVELARMWNKDLWVWCTERRGWFHWTGEAWAAGDPVIDARHIAGTGTRKLDEHAEAALEALFARSFPGT